VTGNRGHLLASEFDIIRSYFDRHSDSVKLGVGDDCALIDIGDGKDLVITTDTLVGGTHFLSSEDPFSIGFKSAAVNLSDLAAMGASPKYALLAITLASSDESWIEGFSSGLYSLLNQYSVILVGGDTTRGDVLSITLTAMGFVSSGAALRRDHAILDDDVWVSGSIGDGAVGLLVQEGTLKFSNEDEQDFLVQLRKPNPRVALGQKLVGIANAAIDISDGLVADAGHVADKSGVQIVIDFERIPTHRALISSKRELKIKNSILEGGDDYELLFTVTADFRDQIENISRELNLNLTRVGTVRSGSGVVVRDDGEELIFYSQGGFDHFAKKK
jgi:thiamine-monophosphate kinase